MRQKYLVADEMFAPDLPTSCYCDQIFNPDKNFIQCKKCKDLIHMDCFLSSETKKCFNGSCNNNIETQLNQSLLDNKKHIDHFDNVENVEKENIMIGNKRRRVEEEKNIAGVNTNNNPNFNANPDLRNALKPDALNIAREKQQSSCIRIGY